jgi:hypothetical protein
VSGAGRLGWRPCDRDSFAPATGQRSDAVGHRELCERCACVVASTCWHATPQEAERHLEAVAIHSGVKPSASARARHHRSAAGWFDAGWGLRGWLSGSPFAGRSVHGSGASRQGRLRRRAVAHPDRELRRRTGARCALALAIWLILPVVICSFIRLSHARLSSCLFGGETANGSIHQLWFIRSCAVTWITVGILELIHAVRLRLPATEGGALLLDRNRPGRISGCDPVSGSVQRFGDSE